jgi:hypothetical protein
MSDAVKLDKELYRQAYRSYDEWNAIEERARARDAARLSAAEAWRQYVALVELCWRLAPEQPEAERQEKLEATERYLAAVQKLEAWRRARGKVA